MDRHAVALCQFRHQIVQRQIGFLSYTRFDSAPHDDKLGVSATISLRQRLKPACCPLHDHLIKTLEWFMLRDLHPAEGFKCFGRSTGRECPHPGASD